MVAVVVAVDHEADLARHFGDTDGRLRSGLIYFDVASMLPDTGGETVTLSLTYLELDNTLKTLTFDYRSPQ